MDDRERAETVAKADTELRRDLFARQSAHKRSTAEYEVTLLCGVVVVVVCYTHVFLQTDLHDQHNPCLRALTFTVCAVLRSQRYIMYCNHEIWEITSYI